MRWSRFIFLFLILQTINVFAGGDPCHKSTEGTDFWFGFMEGRKTIQYAPSCDITLSSSYTCNYSIFIGKSTTASYTGTVLPDSPMPVHLEWTQVEAIGSESIEEKAIHLISDNPLNVYALNYSVNAPEVSMIYPTESLGKEYYAMCYNPHVKITNGGIFGINTGGKNSEFLIAASEDNTLITITPSKVTDKLNSAGVPFQITLNRGELYQVQSANNYNLAGQGDLTGSYITSDKPIALFSGSYATSIPVTASNGFEHLFEQMPPVQTWGRKFVAVPLKTRHEDTYRILASVDQTAIRIGDLETFFLNKGEFREFSLLNTQPSLVESDKPILLAQFSNSNQVDSLYTGGDGDPFMVVVSPVTQIRQKVSFVAYTSNKLTNKFFVNIVVKDNVVGNIMLDDQNIAFTKLSGSGYSYAQASISGGSHSIVSNDPNNGFVAYVYGFGGVEAYGYGVGYNLDIKLDLGSNINANGERLLVRCDGGDPLTIDVGNGFSSYQWSTNESSSSIQVTNSGWYRVSVATGDGCNLKDSVFVKVNKPVVNLGTDTTICNNKTFVLDAGKQFAHYLWSTRDTVSQITPVRSNTYSVNVVDSFGCKASDAITLKVVEPPALKFNGVDTLICGKKSDILNITTNSGSLTFQRLSDGKIFNSPEISVPDYGPYQFEVKATDLFSCNADSVIKITFGDIPTVGFTPTPIGCLETGSNQISYSGNGSSADRYIWDLTQFDLEEILQNPAETSGPLIYDLKNKPAVDIGLKVISQYGCKSRDSILSLKRKPGISIEATPNAGCPPLQSLFTSTIMDPVDRLTYLWDFGDGATVAGDMVSHTYDQPDHKYDVLLTVHSLITGCSDTLKMKEFVWSYPIPQAVFTITNPIVSNSKPAIYFTNSSVGATSYHWDFGDGTTSEQKDPLLQNAKLNDSKIILEAFNDFHCSDTTSHKLSLLFDLIYPPNAFSPNAPNMIDREYLLYATGVIAEGYHLTILSRWNDVMFEVRDEIKGWDGRMKSGSFVSAGVYVWVLDFFDYRGKKHRQTGTVTVVY